MRKGWEYKKLGEVCTLISDGSHNPPKGIDHSLYRMISSQNVFDDNLQITEDNVRYITESDHLCENKRTKLQKDVVLLTIVGTIGRSCVLKGNEGCLTLQRSVAALHPSDQIMPRYLMHCLIGNRHTLNQEAHGIAQKVIYLKQLSSLSIPLPPKSTQLAIVSELDKVNELIRLKKEQLKDFDNLAQSLFYEMFGDPVENEKGWEVKKLGDVCTFSQGMQVPIENQKEIQNEGDVRFLRIIDFTQGKDAPRYVECDNDKYILHEKEIAIVRYGTPGFICTGKIGAIANNLFKLNPVSDNIFVFEYLVHWLSTDAFQLSIKGKQYGAALQAIKFSTIQNIEIILPPLPLQRLFAQRIEQIEREKSEVQKSIQDLETLLASRMQYWFE